MEWIVSNDSLFILPSWVEQEEAGIKNKYGFLFFWCVLDQALRPGALQPC